MRILVTNDDGPLSPGLKLLYNAVKRLDNVKIDVVVPEKPQSAGGLAVTLHKPIRVKRLKIEDMELITVSGRPCDAVIYALTNLDCKYDLVLSGVNLGENTSLQALLASGTISPCAYVAITERVPAVAFSLNVSAGEWVDIETECKICDVIVSVVDFIRQRGLKFPELLDVISVNFPSRITRGSRAVLCDVSDRKFIHDVTRRVDPRGGEYYWIHGHLLIKPDPRLDTYNVYVCNNVVISGLCFRVISVLREVTLEGVREVRHYLEELVEYVNETVFR